VLTGVESPLLRALRSIDGDRLARHLETRGEYDRAFPLFFRAVGQEACARLWDRFPGAVAFVGEDCRGEAGARWPHLARLPLDWVALAFPGVVMWDLHVGVVADLTARPPVVRVGIHASPPVWSRLGPLVTTLDWSALAGTRLVNHEARVVGEMQLVEPPRALALSDLAGEASRLAERATRYYEITSPLPAMAGIVSGPPPEEPRP